MFQLNPHSLSDAWWQHLIMLIVAGVIGYIIAYRRGKALIVSLEDKYAENNVALEKCKKFVSTYKAPAVVKTPFVEVADDLKIIEGIGPQIERLLNQNNIHTYKSLSNSSPDLIKKILEDAGTRFKMHNPSTWPRQASLAADGKWDELKQWQERLDGGVE